MATSELSPVVAAVLAGRGIQDPMRFLDPDPLPLTPPPLDLARAVNRLRQAIEAREPIVVYGDYDVDGIAGTAILVRTLHSLGAQDVRTYIPNRYEEGYGLNEAAIRALASEGARVVVSVDCGVTAVHEARIAREVGVDLIVTDHHHPPKTLPEPYALVNPRRKGDPYPDKELAGAGVAFLLAATIAGDRFDAVRSACLQLAAVATVADVVPLRNANRWLVREGLALLNRIPLAGFRAIAKRSGLRPGGIEAYHIGFVIGPRLNAAGRLADAIEALRILLTDDDAEAKELADALEARNEERQRLTREVVSAARERALTLTDAAVLVIADAAWPAGIVGLAASRLVEEFGRPAAVISIDGPEGKGSCRSIPEVHIAEALAACSEVLTRHGGHAMAAGFSVAADRIDELTKMLDGAVLTAVGGTMPEPTLRIDLEVDSEELIHPTTIQALKALEPTGAGNPRPLFLIRGVAIRDVRRMGEDHLRCKVRAGRWTVDAVAYGKGQAVEAAQAEERLDLVFTLGSGMFGGERGGILQLELRDFQSVPGGQEAMPIVSVSGSET
ncbi:MAG: single-stranded-DNA-specific exonuclease RecJ [Chloroflexi bacterium 13_1_40CM_4_68_4]|nr:MAG: single-stranded-DNA-specific exonuclease RecJ [Chloroflexi bacterium 13_1_40CM_4_68_4]